MFNPLKPLASLVSCVTSTAISALEGLQETITSSLQSILGTGKDGLGGLVGHIDNLRKALLEDLPKKLTFESLAADLAKFRAGIGSKSELAKKWGKAMSNINKVLDDIENFDLCSVTNVKGKDDGTGVMEPKIVDNPSIVPTQAPEEVKEAAKIEKDTSIDDPILEDYDFTFSEAKSDLDTFNNKIKALRSDVPESSLSDFEAEVNVIILHIQKHASSIHSGEMIELKRELKTEAKSLIELSNAQLYAKWCLIE